MHPVYYRDQWLKSAFVSAALSIVRGRYREGDRKRYRNESGFELMAPPTRVKEIVGSVRLSHSSAFDATSKRSYGTPLYSYRSMVLTPVKRALACLVII